MTAMQLSTNSDEIPQSLIVEQSQQSSYAQSAGWGDDRCVTIDVNSSCLFNEVTVVICSMWYTELHTEGQSRWKSATNWACSQLLYLLPGGAGKKRTGLERGKNGFLELPFSHVCMKEVHNDWYEFTPADISSTYLPENQRREHRQEQKESIQDVV